MSTTLAERLAKYRTARNEQAQVPPSEEPVAKILAPEAPEVVLHPEEPRDASLYDVVLITGQRTWTDVPTIWAILDLFSPMLVIHGGAQGADSIAGEWARARSRQEIAIPILNSPKQGYFSWEEHGMQAGTLRNAELLRVTEEIVAHTKARAVLIYFKDEARFGVAKGTNNMLRQYDRMMQMYGSLPDFASLMFPVINGAQWMEEDLLASRPIHRIQGDLELMPIENPDGA